jgi:hypothetical protein
MHHGYSRALVRKAARGARARASDYADSKMGNILHALHLRRLLQGPRPAPRPAPRAPRPAPRAPRPAPRAPRPALARHASGRMVSRRGVWGWGGALLRRAAGAGGAGSNVTAVAVNPGFVRSEIWRWIVGVPLIGPAYTALMRALALTPAQAPRPAPHASDARGVRGRCPPRGARGPTRARARASVAGLRARTNWTHLVPPLVLSGHISSLPSY